MSLSIYKSVFTIAWHKNVTSALNTTFFKTSGLHDLYLVYAHLGSTTEFRK